MFDLHDVADLIRERMRTLADECEAEGDDPNTETARELRRWQSALDVVREAARTEGVLMTAGNVYG